MKYNLKAMEFDPEKTDIFNMFIWVKTPEEGQYWANYHHIPHQEGRDKIAAMLRQWKEEQAMTELPAIGVLHKHDGSDESPLPVGTILTFWMPNGHCERFKETGTLRHRWVHVVQYLVHSYPEIKQVTGTVTYTNGEPDFKTWKEA